MPGLYFCRFQYPDVIRPRFFVCIRVVAALSLIFSLWFLYNAVIQFHYFESAEEHASFERGHSATN